MAAVWPDTSLDVEAIIRDAEEAKRGDRRAYARLVERHQRLVSAITLAITTDVDASEDAAQEAFLAGWRDLSKLDNLASFGPWICQIARNRAHDIVRKRSRTKPADAGEIEAAPDPDPDALEALIDCEQSQLITGALQALPEEGREAIILFYREGQSIAQVAEALEVSEDVVKKRLSRAREKMRQSVESALGLALVATIPTGDFSAAILGRISAGGFIRLPRSAAHRLFATAAKLAGVGAAAVITVQLVKAAPARKMVYQPAVSRAPEIRGTIVGEKNATGTVTLDCQGDQRTVKIEKGSFDVRDLPPGSCSVTFALDGLPNPAPQNVTVAQNEVFNYALHVVKNGPHPKVSDLPGIPGIGAMNTAKPVVTSRVKAK